MASILFWRIAADGDIFKQLSDYERLGLAIEAVQIVKKRWLITREADLLNIATSLFANQNLFEEYHILRTRIMSEWLKAFELAKNSEWAFIRQILDTFVELGFSFLESNLEERNLLNKIIDASGDVKDPVLKNDATRIASLFA